MVKGLIRVALVFSLLGSGTAFSAQGFETIGLYVWRDTPDQHAFWKACGLNTLQFCDTGWHQRADLLDDYYAGFAADVASAQRDGFKVWVILFSNIAQWLGPEDFEPTGTGVKFYPRDRAALDSRLHYLAKTVKALKAADGFSFFAGDPGGVPSALGPAELADWTNMALEVEAVVKREAPKAKFNLNPWAIAMWVNPELSAMTSAWWVAEHNTTKALLETEGILGEGSGLELAGHNYYRALALRTLSAEGLQPELLPTAEDARKLRARGVNRLWAWPYFLLDEADDGDESAAGSLWGQTQIDTRYIHQYVNQMREVGMTGIIGNWSYNGYLPGALNTYAFGRFASDLAATPEQVLAEYAHYVADGATAPSLIQIFRFIENHSNWEQKLPPEHRLPAFKCSLHSARAALARLETVQVNPAPGFPLPEPPEDYLRRVQGRLETIQAREQKHSAGKE